MHESVTESGFIDAFRRMDRMDGWSYPGLRALYEYLEQYEEDTGTQIELDVVSLCCDFSEYSTALEAAEEFGFKAPGKDEGEEEDEYEDRAEEEATEWLGDRTSVIPFTGGVIVQSF